MDGRPFIPANTPKPPGGALLAAWRSPEDQQGIMDIGVLCKALLDAVGPQEGAAGRTEGFLCPVTRSRQDTLASFAEDLNQKFLWETNPKKTTESGITTASPEPENAESKMGKKKGKQSDNAVGAMADAREELRRGLTSPEKPPGSNDPSKGIIQDAKIVFSPNGYITHCPNLNRKFLAIKLPPPFDHSTAETVLGQPIR
ncbi:NELL1 protein, partial [Polypterus senegalus]